MPIVYIPLPRFVFKEQQTVALPELSSELVQCRRFNTLVQCGGILYFLTILKYASLGVDKMPQIYIGQDLSNSDDMILAWEKPCPDCR